MIGAIIGDVVGSRFEFHNIKTKKFLMFHPYCHVTDDSIMTIAIAKSLCEYSSGVGELEDLCVKNMQKFGRKIHATYGRMFYKWIWSDNPEPYNSYGNGAAMRVSPVAYFADSLEKCRELARRVTAVTHNHPQALKGAECVASCVYLSLHNYDKDYIRKYVNENFYNLDFTLDEIRDTYTYQGDCDGTVPYAVECFLEGKDFEDVIRNAISIGGDSDTIAAIAGSMAEPIMPRKYYKIVRHYCRKNFFLWRQFKYVEMARANVMKYYDKKMPEYEAMFLPFMKQKRFKNWENLLFVKFVKNQFNCNDIKRDIFSLNKIIRYILFLIFVATNIVLNSQKIIDIPFKNPIIFSLCKILGYYMFLFVCYLIVDYIQGIDSPIMGRIDIDFSPSVSFYLYSLSKNQKTIEVENEKLKWHKCGKSVDNLQRTVNFIKKICVVAIFVSSSVFLGSVLISLVRHTFNAAMFQKITESTILIGSIFFFTLICFASIFDVLIIRRIKRLFAICYELRKKCDSL